MNVTPGKVIMTHFSTPSTGTCQRVTLSWNQELSLPPHVCMHAYICVLSVWTHGFMCPLPTPPQVASNYYPHLVLFFF